MIMIGAITFGSATPPGNEKSCFDPTLSTTNTTMLGCLRPMLRAFSLDLTSRPIQLSTAAAVAGISPPYPSPVDESGAASSAVAAGADPVW